MDTDRFIPNSKFISDWDAVQALFIVKATTNYRFGAHSPRATPVPIPNTAVKPRSGYNTWGSPLGK